MPMPLWRIWISNLEEEQTNEWNTVLPTCKNSKLAFYGGTDMYVDGKEAFSLQKYDFGRVGNTDWNGI